MATCLFAARLTAKKQTTLLFLRKRTVLSAPLVLTKKFRILAMMMRQIVNMKQSFTNLDKQLWYA